MTGILIKILLGIVFSGFTATLVVKSYKSHKRKRKYQRLQKQFAESELIDQELEEIFHEVKRNHGLFNVMMWKYHNGMFYVNGDSILKASPTNYKSRSKNTKNVDFEKKELFDLNLERISNEVSKLWKNHILYSHNGKVNTYLQSIFSRLNIETMLMVVVHGKYDYPIGFLSFSFSEKVEQVNEKRFLEFAEKITNLIK